MLRRTRPLPREQISTPVFRYLDSLKINDGVNKAELRAAFDKLSDDEADKLKH